MTIFNKKTKLPKPRSSRLGKNNLDILDILFEFIANFVFVQLL